MLTEMMERQGGAFKLSTTHNSNFEISKVTVMHTSQCTTKDILTGISTKLRNRAPLLIIHGKKIKEVDEYKYLGILINTELRWKSQTLRATEKAMKWVLMYKRLTKPSTGVQLSLMRQLYITVGIPKMTYALDAWYTPPQKSISCKRNTGSVSATMQMMKVQCIACLAITGALKTTATDIVESHANITPMQTTLR